MAVKKKVRETNAFVRWEEPPAPAGGRGVSERNEAIAEALKAKPGEWALVAEAEKNDGLAVAIRKGRAVSFRQGIWEAKTRRNEDGTIKVYARYVGEVPE